ncbi:MAG: S1/P1 Nuclease [Bacteroidetes bacterium]|nr:S1/P1 Nuclease [Bacteroidota bacterium]
MDNKLCKVKLRIALIVVLLLCSSWGFFGHKKINRLAVFTLPSDMIGFYKKNIQFLEEAAVNPDRRRYIQADEAARHFIDLDAYGDSAFFRVPHFWKEASAKFGEDSLKAHGILPWNIARVYLQLKEAFQVKDPERILKLSADLGHYVADAHVPLHTTKNYDGQLTNQSGIHAFWESRLPELFSGNYNFVTGKARYIENVQETAWRIAAHTNQSLDSVLRLEKQLSEKWSDKRFNFETQGRQTVKVFSSDYAKAYHSLLNGMVERQMRASILMTGSLWFTAWVDAGQPDLKQLLDYKASSVEIKRRQEELKKWKAAQKPVERSHEFEE